MTARAPLGSATLSSRRRAGHVTRRWASASRRSSNARSFRLACPFSMHEGNFVGMVSASLESSRLAILLSRNRFRSRRASLSRRCHGKVIAHVDPTLVAILAGPVGYPVRRSVPGRSDAHRLAAGSPVRKVGCWSAMHASLIWIGALLSSGQAPQVWPRRMPNWTCGLVGYFSPIAAAAGFGSVGSQLAQRTPGRPLGAAVDSLAAGDSAAPLPTTGFTEIVGLAAAFATMRTRLASSNTGAHTRRGSPCARATSACVPSCAMRPSFCSRFDSAGVFTFVEALD